MTDIHFINDYYTAIIARLVSAGFDVKKLLLVRSETELVLDIKDIAAGEFFLAVVIPSTDTRAENIDNVKEVEPWLIYLLEKTDRKAVTQANRLTSVAQQQQILRRIKEFMRADMGDGTIPCKIRPDLNSMHSDPEENFMGCEGYSLSFKVMTDDFFTSNP